MAEAQDFKKIEAEASKKRMAALQEIENERQIKLHQQLQNQAKKEKTMLIVTISIMAVLIIVVLFALFLS